MFVRILTATQYPPMLDANFLVKKMAQLLVLIPAPEAARTRTTASLKKALLIHGLPVPIHGLYGLLLAPRLLVTFLARARARARAKTSTGWKADSSLKLGLRSLALMIVVLCALRASQLLRCRASDRPPARARARAREGAMT